MPSARAGTSLVAKGRLVEPHRKCLTDVWSLALCNGAASDKGQAIGLKHCDPMSELGHFQTLSRVPARSACPSTADMRRPHRHVGFVPRADVTLLNRQRSAAMT